jgi:hypothetical protein
MRGQHPYNYARAGGRAAAKVVVAIQARQDEQQGKRRLKFGRFGLTEDPRGQIVTWSVGERTYLAEVTGCEYDHFRGITLLQTTHFNGEPGPEVPAGIVHVLFNT